MRKSPDQEMNRSGYQTRGYQMETFEQFTRTCKVAMSPYPRFCCYFFIVTLVTEIRGSALVLATSCRHHRRYVVTQVVTVVDDVFIVGKRVSAIRGFHKHTKVSILALLPTLYSHVFTVSFFICNI